MDNPSLFSCILTPENITRWRTGGQYQKRNLKESSQSGGLTLAPSSLGQLLTAARNLSRSWGRGFFHGLLFVVDLFYHVTSDSPRHLSKGKVRCLNDNSAKISQTSAFSRKDWVRIWRRRRWNMQRRERVMGNGKSRKECKPFEKEQQQEKCIYCGYFRPLTG